MSNPWKDEWVSPCGMVRLILGDSLKVIPFIGNFDCAVTDPPYGVSGAVSGRRRQAGWKESTEYTQNNWCDDDSHIASCVLPVISILVQRTKRMAVTPGFRQLWKYPQPKHVGSLFYGAQSATTSWGMAYWQPILFYGKDPHPMRPDTIYARPNPPGFDIGHPCPKEVDSWTKLVERASLDSDIIIDPFCGSGTTGVSCVRLRRRFIGIDIEPKYFDISRKRIEIELREGPKGQLDSNGNEVFKRSQFKRITNNKEPIKSGLLDL